MLSSKFRNDFMRVARKAALSVLIPATLMSGPVAAGAEQPAAAAPAVTQSVFVGEVRSELQQQENNFEVITIAEGTTKMVELVVHDIDKMGARYPFLADFVKEVKEQNTAREAEGNKPAEVSSAHYIVGGKEFVFVAVESPAHCTPSGCLTSVYVKDKDAKEFTAAYGSMLSGPAYLSQNEGKASFYVCALDSGREQYSLNTQNEFVPSTASVPKHVPKCDM